jgi:hypothetical protein
MRDLFIFTLSLISLGWLTNSFFNYITETEKNKFIYYGSKLYEKELEQKYKVYKTEQKIEKRVQPRLGLAQPKIVKPTKEIGVGENYFIEVRGLDDITKVNFNWEDIPEEDRLPEYTEEEKILGRPILVQ